MIRTVEQAGLLAGALVAILTLIGIVWRGWRRLDERVLTPIEHMWQDWQGTPGRPGVPERPGVMERLGRMEETQATQGRLLAEVVRQVCPNGGSSMHDKIVAVRDAVAPER